MVLGTGLEPAVMEAGLRIDPIVFVKRKLTAMNRQAVRQVFEIKRNKKAGKTKRSSRRAASASMFRFQKTKSKERMVGGQFLAL